MSDEAHGQLNRRDRLAKTIQGRLSAQGWRVEIMASRWNDFIVSRLIGGATDQRADDEIIPAACNNCYAQPLRAKTPLDRFSQTVSPVQLAVSFVPHSNAV